MTGTPTLDYDAVERNGSNITTGTDATWGKFLEGTNTAWSADDPTEWDRLLIHPHEAATTNRAACGFNTDTYTLKFSATANTTRGKVVLKRAYGEWHHTNNDYDYTLDTIADVTWTTDAGNPSITLGTPDAIEYEIDVDVDLLEDTAHTFVCIAQGTEADYVNTSTPLHDYKVAMIQVMPIVDLPSYPGSLSLTNKLHAVTDDKLTFTTASGGASAITITFDIDHSHCNGSTATEGEGAWVWFKETTFKSEDITWGADTTATTSLTIDNEVSPTTINYYLELFQYKGLRSGFDSGDTAVDDPRADGLAYDRRIHVEVIYT